MAVPLGALFFIGAYVLPIPFAPGLPQVIVSATMIGLAAMTWASAIWTWPKPTPPS